jgi:hypothetical protein
LEEKILQILEMNQNNRNSDDVIVSIAKDVARDWNALQTDVEKQIDLELIRPTWARSFRKRHGNRVTFSVPTRGESKEALPPDYECRKNFIDALKNAPAEDLEALRNGHVLGLDEWSVRFVPAFAKLFQRKNELSCSSIVHLLMWIMSHWNITEIGTCRCTFSLHGVRAVYRCASDMELRDIIIY